MDTLPSHEATSDEVTANWLPSYVIKTPMALLYSLLIITAYTLQKANGSGNGSVRDALL